MLPQTASSKLGHKTREAASSSIVAAIMERSYIHALQNWLSASDLSMCNLILVHVVVPPWLVAEPLSGVQGLRMLQQQRQQILQAAEFLQNCTALVQERFPLISVHWQVEAGDQAASLCSIARATNSQRLVIFADVLTKGGKNHARLLKTLVESCPCRLEVIPVLPVDKLASDHGYHSL